MSSKKTGERKTQILQMLATMLEQPKGEKITTAALASKLDVSEAALYRHFASKAQMFEGLIAFIETTVFDEIDRIGAQASSGLAKVEAITAMLLDFAERNPGMTRVMIGDALVNQDGRLQQRMNRFLERVELATRQALEFAAAEGKVNGTEVVTRAHMIISLVLGLWHRFVKSGFKECPSQSARAQIALLMH